MTMGEVWLCELLGCGGNSGEILERNFQTCGAGILGSLWSLKIKACGGHIGLAGVHANEIFNQAKQIKSNPMKNIRRIEFWFTTIFVLAVYFVMVPPGVSEELDELGGELEAVASDESHAWMGVATLPLPKVVAEHKQVTPGTGLVVELVVEGSPAEVAGIQSNDVLTHLDDQILVSPEQLSVLLKHYQPGDEVEIKLLRKEEPEELRVALGERPAEFAMQQEQPPAPAVPEPRIAPAPPADLPATPDEIIEQLRQRADRLFGEEFPGFDLQHRFEMDFDEMWRMLERQIEEGMEGIPQNRVEGRVLHMENQHLTIRDPEGSITIRRENGDATIEARDPDGGLIYEGPYTTEADKEKVPEDVRRRAERVNIQALDSSVFEEEPEIERFEGDVDLGDRVD